MKVINTCVCVCIRFDIDCLRWFSVFVRTFLSPLTNVKFDIIAGKDVICETLMKRLTSCEKSDFELCCHQSRTWKEIIMCYWSFICISGAAADWSVRWKRWRLREALWCWCRAVLVARRYRGGSGPLHVSRGKTNHPLHKAFIEAGQQAGYPFTEDMNGHQQEGLGWMDMTIHKGTIWI